MARLTDDADYDVGETFVRTSSPLQLIPLPCLCSASPRYARDSRLLEYTRSPIRLALHFYGEEYREELYEQGDAPNFSKAEWKDKKDSLGYDFPNGLHKAVFLTSLPRHLGLLSNYLGSKKWISGDKVRTFLLI
ncbi:unnamed protein product [Protopolystoma xenopodis]|uniref:Uncharacterized protein n=1 Tax=Protopolystoma xenopodis TaxID=117903 RepID=A0A448XSN1_9PLAT|nr:unnamed protein product [Protopolystoma xenopodis]